MLTEIEKRLLNEIQRNFPIEIHPYATIAKRLNITEEHCLELLDSLTKREILRGIRAIPSNKMLGYQSVLVGAHVDDSHIDEVAGIISVYSGVTHNYQREGSLNLWFTFTYEDPAEKEQLLSKLRMLPHVGTIHEFTSEKTYKIGLVLDV